MRDVLPPNNNNNSNKRSIRQVAINKNRQFKNGPSSEAIPNGFSLSRIFKKSEENKNSTGKKSNNKKIVRLGLSSLVAIIILYFGFSYLFSGAVISVTPRESNITVNGKFSAYKESDDSLNLKYEIMTVSEELSSIVPATGEKFVERKASGNIIIYNNYDSSSQKLIKNTRFETPEGLIFRIDKSVTVKGRKTENGKTVPGSIEVTVYADQPGEAYNIGLTDFTIPGLKGDPRFDKFYARSKSSMIGGISGTIKTVDDAVLENTKSSMRQKLKNNLLVQANSVKPEGFVLYNDGVFVDFELLPNEQTEDSVIVKERAILRGVIFNKKDLSQYLAKNILAGYDGLPVEADNLDDLKFTIEDRGEVRPWEEDTFNFSLEGQAHLLWLFDEESLKEDLTDKTKISLPIILSAYPGIENAEAIVRPFWRRMFPDDSSRIKIEKIIK